MTVSKKVTVSSLSDKGEGIAFADGLEIYIPLALPGEELEVQTGEPFAKGSRRCPGRIVSIIAPSEHRTEPGCSYFPECGGCQLQHMNPEGQLAWRRELIVQALIPALKAAAGPAAPGSASAVGQAAPGSASAVGPAAPGSASAVGPAAPGSASAASGSPARAASACPVGSGSGLPAGAALSRGAAAAGLKPGFTDEDIASRARELVEPVVSGQSGPCRFKSIRYFAHNSLSGKLEQGFYRARSHELIAIESCPQEPECFGLLAASLTSVLDNCAVRASAGSSAAYGSAEADSVAAGAAARALQLRMAEDRVMVLLILSAAPDAHVMAAIKEWAAAHPEVGSFYLGINNSKGNALYCNEVQLVSGEPLLVKKLNGISCQMGPQTFMQVNYDMAQKLYQRAVEHCAQRAGAAPAAGDEDELALDLCCGTGTMTMALAREFRQVLGVEIVESAVEAATQNAGLNSLDNVHFIAADINRALPGLLTRDSRSKVRAVIADPARAGLGELCARQTGKIPGPCALSLIFCSLTALKRDLPVLLKAGFTLQSVQGFDMFPSTTHVETLCLLTKKA